MRHGLFAIATVILASACVVNAAKQPPLDFDRDVAPLFAGRCFDCHNSTEHKGGLDLTRKSAAMKGGDDGEVIVPGKSTQSTLWKNVESNEMPPKHPLSDEEKRTLKRWIDSGATWGTETIDPFRFTSSKRAGYDWWSLQPPQKPNPPSITDSTWPRNSIDRFILAGLSKEGLKPSPQADRRTLIRRLSFDLIGLPPTPEEVEAFVKDDAPEAYERRVDRLLSSPEYGVRWARHWLDLVRFGESNGFERDQLRPNAWRYRDWVVNAFNADLPYDQFARLQLAGDLLRPNTAEGVIATGFLTAGAFDQVGNDQQSAAMRAVVRQDELEDLVGTVSQTFLGLTANCARCHDHKFDPISQKEYYQLTSALAGVKHGEREIPSSQPTESDKIWTNSVDARLAKVKADLETIEPAERGVREQLAYEIKAIRRQQGRLAVARTYTNTPVSQPPVAKVLLRGNPAKEAEIVSLAGIASIVGLPANWDLKPDAPDADRRLKLAEWITSPTNPLFARTIVNRLWQYHFGAGIVDTPNDFGFNGGKPTHSELLDYLAGELAAGNWSLKRIHKLMVMSATYRQSSLPLPDAQAKDASNRFLWRMIPRRIEAEALRDAVLAVSGQLNPLQGGPGYEDYFTFTSNSTFYEARAYVGDTFNRRSLFRTWVRSGRSPLLDVFDCPDPSTKTPRRAVTTTPLQALALMNDSFVLRMADSLADRAKFEAGEMLAKQILRVYELTLTRKPTSAEADEAQSFVTKHGLSAFCRVMMNSSEFVLAD